MKTMYGFPLVTLLIELSGCGSESIPIGNADAADFVDNCGDGCTRSDEAASCAVPREPVDASAEGCGAGEIWVSSYMAMFNAFCGKVCTISSDCPPGGSCVKGNILPGYVGGLCVSDLVPTPLCGTTGIIEEGPAFACLDADTLGTKYVNNRTGIAGYEMSKCPNGCQGGGPDGGIWGMTPGNCR